MSLNIEKRNLDVVQEDINYQPNEIRLKPSSRKNISINVISIPMSISDIENTKKEASEIQEKNEIERITIAEIKTADLFLFNQDVAMIDNGYKPINLSAKMFENVLKKHDLCMKKFNEMTNINDDIIANDYSTETESNDNLDESPEFKEDNYDGLENVFVAIDSVINEDSIEAENNSQDEINDLNDATMEFINLINNEVQTEKDLSGSQEKLDKVTKELEEANEIEKQEIVKKYEFEESIKVETERQKRILKEQSEKVNLRIAEMKKEKADIDMQTEEKTSELENTNINIESIRKENVDLAEIYNAIINSNENKFENSDDGMAPIIR